MTEKQILGKVLMGRQDKGLPLHQVLDWVQALIIRIQGSHGGRFIRLLHRCAATASRQECPFYGCLAHDNFASAVFVLTAKSLALAHSHGDATRGETPVVISRHAIPFPGI
jgi:hypothetical protein